MPGKEYKQYDSLVIATASHYPYRELWVPLRIQVLRPRHSQQASMGEALHGNVMAGPILAQNEIEMDKRAFCDTSIMTE